MDWSAFIPSMLGAAIPICAFAFWLGRLAQRVEHVQQAVAASAERINQTCVERRDLHEKHFDFESRATQLMGNWAARIEECERRLLSLEKRVEKDCRPER